MKTTVQTSRGPVRFHSVGEPIAGIPATQASQHTPGPWACSNGLPTVWTDGGSRQIADCDKGPLGTASQDLANARLIAAAPELLAALEWLQKSMEEYQQAILAGNEITLGMTMRADGGLDKARTVIARAKGQP